ncbi:MAG: hypothetical protein R2856_10515 [Caldilineaceae bacterium]
MDGAGRLTRDGAPGSILDAEKLPFDDSLFAPGDMVPGIVKSPAVGDSGDYRRLLEVAGWRVDAGIKQTGHRF